MDNPNVILIVFDTLRSDAVGCYGGKTLTPNVDNFCQEAIRFEHAVAPASWTTPSHASIFTGEYSSKHGIHESNHLKVDNMHGLVNGYSGTMLGEMLKRHGYNNVAFSANPNISNGSGFDRGFSSFVDIPILPDFSEEEDNIRSLVPASVRHNPVEAVKYLAFKGRFASLASTFLNYRKMVSKAKRSEYPKNKGGRMLHSILNNSSYELPLFLFMNFMEMHEPYIGSESSRLATHSSQMQLLDLFHQKPISSRLMKRITTQYYSQSSRIDSYFGMVLKYLKSADIYDSSLIIVTSDHGQAMHEHGFYGHGIFLSDELTRVPLLVKMPKGNELRVKPYGWQSLSSIYSFIANMLDGDISMSNLCSEVVFSESFGIHNSLRDIPTTRVTRTESQDDAIDVPRKAVYTGSEKLVVQGRDGKIEELSKNGAQLDIKNNRALASDLLTELDLFRGSEKFLLPNL